MAMRHSEQPRRVPPDQVRQRLVRSQELVDGPIHVTGRLLDGLPGQEWLVDGKPAVVADVLQAPDHHL